MNKQLLVIGSCLVLAASSMAQIPNAGFEDWQSAGDYLEPVLWSTSNVVTFSLGAVLSCEQGSPGAEGSYYAKVTTRDLGNFGVFPGLVHSGDASVGGTGFPWTSRPGALNGMWQYHPQGADQGTVLVTLTKWNTSTQTQDAIGAGSAAALSAITSWQNFSVAINYVSSLDPDTANIVILSSSGAPVDGSSMWVDALGFGVAQGVQEQASTVGFDLYPSPANDQLHITAAAPLAEVSMQDMSGRVLVHQAITGVSTVVDVAQLPAGIYMARVRFGDGRIAALRFVKS